MQILSQEEVNRYSRQLILPELGFEGQQKLKNASVLVLGAGGLGGPVLQYLVGAGVGNIGIVDFDTVDESNLHRQLLFNHNDIGQNKATVAADKLNVLNPHVNLKAFAVKFDQKNGEELISEYDFLIDGSDNFTTRYAVNDVCVAAGKPWVFGSVFKFEGQVSVFNLRSGSVYREVYPDAKDNNSVPNCAETGVIGVLPGIVGLFMANEAIKLICGIGENLSGKLLTYDALTNDFNVYKLQTEDRKETGRKNNRPEEIDFDDALELEDLFLLDVREEWEFEEFNKGGVNIPLNFLPATLESLKDRNPIVCCCNFGNKSKIAADLIKSKYPEKTVYSLKGGLVSK